MDAEGRIHNSPRPAVKVKEGGGQEDEGQAGDGQKIRAAGADSENNGQNTNTNTKKASIDRPKDTASDAASNTPVDVRTDSNAKVPAAEEYLSEAELEAALEQERQEHPPFFIWTDTDGRVRSEFIPQGAVAGGQENNADSETVFYDHILIPPQRVASAVRQSGCCAAFRQQAKPLRAAGSSTIFRHIQQNSPFPARSGLSPAWYFYNAENTDAFTLTLRIRSTDVDAALIAVDDDFVPLHYLERMQEQTIPANWHRQAYRESVIRIEDPDVRGYILFFRGAVPEDSSLEVEWF
ncbi:MAG: hypothetical protein CMI08_12075 [Oceanospirillaceae bacterium]|uniref:hypothetical protein n=1 Tax=unclassified Thalassolituus TaxID=2624967 RepID=UPI000C35E51E|nr:MULTISPECIES: hypothetical protein [unclassified Thalassolituus]MAS25284.1 hypothetical protein [Oceanospirillaceae bacterium]MAX99914.1 hypothetical protein [Oceanospirillaceae bacterium]MBL34799.1 hypothetical protein [Oceanospirillaceae bacterium]MBS53419.1 hypothetical protein [Oceanospirillaceae bacterium]